MTDTVCAKAMPSIHQAQPAFHEGRLKSSSWICIAKVIFPDTSQNMVWLFISFCSIKIRSCVFLSNCLPGAETASWQLEKCWAKLNSSELIPDFASHDLFPNFQQFLTLKRARCFSKTHRNTLRLQPEFSQLMGEWYRQDKDLIQKSGCRANILLKSKWKMRWMEEDLDVER